MRKVARTGILALLAALCSASALAQYSQPVRDVENPARTPFWGYGSGTFNINFINMQLLVGIIPTGQRLVIEHVSIGCTMDADDNVALVTISVTKATGGGGATSWSVPVPVQKQGSTWDGKANWTASQPVRLYSDGVNFGTYVSIHHSKIAATPYCWTFVSGHTLATQ